MNTTHTLRITAGVAIVLLGVGVLLANLNLFHFGEVLSTWWPLIIVALGLYAIAADSKRLLWPIVAITAGVALQLRSLEVIDFNIWQLFWPALIIIVGVSILTGAMRKTSTAPGSDSNAVAILSGVSTRSNATDYKGGKVTAVLGGVEIDLTKATIKKEATLEVFALMGGAEIRVPDSWVVRSEAMAILGGVENNTKPDGTKDAPILTIVGTVSLGGVEVRN